MKNLIGILSALLFSSAVFAQSPIGQGAFTIGGNITYYSQSFDDSDDSQSVFTFNPQLGYFFADNLYTALSLTYLNYSSGDVSSSQYGIGPAFRYYFDADKLKPFLGGSYTYFEQTNSGNDDKVTSNEFKLTCGADYFVSKGLAIEASINYSFVDYNFSTGASYYDDSSTLKKFEIGVGVNYFIY